MQKRATRRRAQVNLSLILAVIMVILHGGTDNVAVHCGRTSVGANISSNDWVDFQTVQPFKIFEVGRTTSPTGWKVFQLGEP